MAVNGKRDISPTSNSVLTITGVHDDHVTATFDFRSRLSKPEIGPMNDCELLDRRQKTTGQIISRLTRPSDFIYAPGLRYFQLIRSSSFVRSVKTDRSDDGRDSTRSQQRGDEDDDAYVSLSVTSS